MRKCRPRLCSLADRIIERRRRLAATAVAMLWCVTSIAHAQIFGSQDDGGNLVLSNHALTADDQVVIDAPAAEPAPGAQEIVSPMPLSVRAPSTETPPRQVPLGLAGILRDAARRHAVPVALLQAVVAVESGFDGRAVSRKGAKGLMQLMPDTARRFGVKDVFAADQNVLAGAAYLRVLMNQFPEDLTLALAAYNAGEGAVLRAGRRIPPYPETQRYVRRVLHHASQWSSLDATTRR